MLASAVLSGVLIWLLLTRIDAQEFLSTLARIHLPGLGAFLAIAFTGAVLRAWRYRWLLRPQSIGWGDILLVTFIRNLFVDLLPARIGSLSYVYLINKTLKRPFEAAASSFVLAFILDFLTLSPFLVFSVLAVGLGSSALSSSAMMLLACLFFAVVFLVFWKVTSLARFFLRVYIWLLRAFHQEKKRWASSGEEKIRATMVELQRMKEEKKAWALYLLSLAIRMAKYGSLYFLVFSLMRSHGFSLTDLDFPTVILGITGAELTSILPVKGIGGFGTWESAWSLTLVLMGFDTRTAVLSSGIHLITNLFEYILGILGILLFSLPRIRSDKPGP